VSVCYVSYLPSLIPNPTGSAKAIQAIFPDLKGKINGVAVRVNIQNASLTDLVIETVIIPF
jgi:glyceraldehyde 3-phosphate dehydrogenase